jgi:hypothetical protein
MASLFALLAFAAGISLPGTAKLGLGGLAMAQGGYAIDQFYDELAPYGEWVYHPRYNYVWLPRAVDQGWRPYSVGQWLSTNEYGWYWDSYEPFAWAVYHYGRWGYEYDYGWYWVPGDTWAPAWVQWRYGTEYVGWAPVRPSSYGGYAYGGPARYAPPPRDDAWIFVRQTYLTSNVLYRHVLPRGNVYVALNRTTYVVRPHYRNGHVYNYGMPRDRWSRITRQRVHSHKIHRGNHRSQAHGSKGRRGRDVHVYAPGVRKGVKPRHAPKKAHHRPHNAKGKANAKHYGNPRGRTTANRPPHRRAAPAGASRSGTVPSAGVAPRRGANEALINPNIRHKPGAAKSKAAKAKAAKVRAAKAKAARTNKGKAHSGKAHSGKAHSGKAHRPQPNQARARRPQPNKAKGHRPPPNKAKAHRPQPNKANAHKAQPNPNRSKAGKSKASKSKGGKPRNAKAANAGAAKAKAAKARSANAKAAKARAARARTPNARAANQRAVNAKAARAKVAKAKPNRAKAAKPKPSKSRSAKAKPAKAKSAKAKSAKAKSAKSRSARAKPGAAHSGHGRGKKGGGGKGKKKS